MTIFNISYDLTQPDRDYETVIAKIKELGSWAHPVKSTWLVDTALSMGDVKSLIAATMDSNDKLIVTICAKGATWQKLPDNVSKWIKERL